MCVSAGYNIPSTSLPVPGIHQDAEAGTIPVKIGRVDQATSRSDAEQSKADGLPALLHQL